MAEIGMTNVQAQNFGRYVTFDMDKQAEREGRWRCLQVAHDPLAKPEDVIARAVAYAAFIDRGQSNE